MRRELRGPNAAKIARPGIALRNRAAARRTLPSSCGELVVDDASPPRHRDGEDAQLGAAHQIDGFDSVRIFEAHGGERRADVGDDGGADADGEAGGAGARPRRPSVDERVPAMSSSAPHWWRPSERPSIATVSTAVASVFSW